MMFCMNYASNDTESNVNLKAKYNGVSLFSLSIEYLENQLIRIKKWLSVDHEYPLIIFLIRVQNSYVVNILTALEQKWK